MSNAMYHYIFEQPDALRRVWEHRQEDAQVFVQLFKEKKLTRIYLIGSGSSLNAAKAAAPAMEELLDMEVTPVASSVLPKFRDKNAFLIFISQGGNSVNTVTAIKEYAEYPHMAITGMESCTVNDISEHVLIRCGEENAGPKTKGYISTFFLLYCISLESAKEFGQISACEYEKRVKATETAIDQMTENIKVADAWMDRNIEMMKSMEKCVCIGKHIGQAAALESALKLQETILIPAAGYEYEEFLHGPDMAIDEKMAGLYLIPEKSDKDYDRFVGLVQYHRTKSPYVYTVGGGEEFQTDQDLHIGIDAPEELRLLSWCLPSQLMGSRIPELVGREGKGHLIFDELDAILSIKAKHK